MGGAEVNDFFSMNPNLNFFFFRWGVWGGGARVSDIFSKNPNLINPDKLGRMQTHAHTPN